VGFCGPPAEPGVRLIGIAAAGLRTHCSDPGTNYGYPTTPANAPKRSNPVEAVQSSGSAAEQPTPATNGGTCGAATTPAGRRHSEQRDPRAADRKEDRKEDAAKRRCEF
jgi:hypothetical protein